MASFLGTPKVQYFDNNGNFLSAGKIYTSDAGFSFEVAPKSTYPTIADALAGTNANTNPVILDSRGEATVVLQGDTRVVLKDSNNNVIWTVDHVDQGTTDIYDSNGNEELTFTSVASAVNYVNITNASTTNSPMLKSLGDDTNVALKILSKGSAALYLDGGTTGDLELNSTSTGTIRARRALACASTLSVTGATTLSGTLDVIGATTTTGLITANGGLTIPNGQAFSVFPAGMIIAYAGTTTPTGWLLCDGSAVSRTTYATLFTNISTTWGSGDGSTTFNVPNLQRRALVGKGGSGTATLANTVGSTGGEETHTMTSAELVAHTHTMTAGARSNFITTAGTSAGNSTTGFVDNTNFTSASGSAGSTTPFNVVQPSAVVTYIIKAY